MATKSDSSAK